MYKYIYIYIHTYTPFPKAFQAPVSHRLPETFSKFLKLSRSYMQHSG